MLVMKRFNNKYMKQELIQTLTGDFESFSHRTENGIEFWFARELQHLLGYDTWRNFKGVISKAKTSCEVSGHEPVDHFVDVSKKVKIGSDADREVDDVMLTRYACYLIAQNGDSSKEEIAFAQSYFAVQTRRLEIIQQRIKDLERIMARQKLSETEKQLSGLIFEKTRDNRNFAFIRSKGDKALFGKTTQEMKHRLGIPKSRALSDFLPTITVKAKDFATEITIFNIKYKGLRTEASISDEHVVNNRRVRKTLLERGIQPENLSAEEDIKKVERRIKSDERQVPKGGKNLKSKLC